MRRYFIHIVLLLTLIAVQSSAQTEGFAVLELYTSEGCSSCPKAEALMPELEKIYPDNLYILEFHVDYWNYLGWSDKFSKNQFSTRQRSYAKVFGANTVYTPQAVINGKTHKTGSDKKGITELIKHELTTTKNRASIKLSADRIDDELKVRYTANLKEGEIINIAIILPKATVKVQRGENSGRRLTHHNVVLQYFTRKTSTGTVTFKLPQEYTDCQLIGYTQAENNMQVIGVTRINI